MRHRHPAPQPTPPGDAEAETPDERVDMGVDGFASATDVAVVGRVAPKPHTPTSADFGIHETER